MTPIEGNQPLPGVGDPSTWASLQSRRPLFPFNPAITDISTTAARGRVRLQRAADDLQAAAVERPGLHRQLHAEQRQVEQPGLLRLGQRRGRRRLSGQQLRHRSQLRPGVLRRAAHHLGRRQLRAAVRQGPPVRQRLEPRHRRGGRRMVGELRRHARTPGTRSRCRTASGARCRARARPNGRT